MRHRQSQTMQLRQLGRIIKRLNGCWQVFSGRSAIILSALGGVRAPFYALFGVRQVASGGRK